MNRAATLALLALFVLPALGTAHAQDAPELAASWRAIADDLAAGRPADANATYLAAFAAPVAARNATLDAAIRNALAQAEANPNGTLAYELAAQQVEKGLLHAAFAGLDHALFAQPDPEAAPAWFDVLLEAFGSRLAVADVGIEDVEHGADPQAEIVEHRPLIRDEVTKAFAGKAREEMDGSLYAWDEGDERIVAATEASLYYEPLRAQAPTDAFTRFVAAARAGDKADAQQAAKDAGDALATLVDAQALPADARLARVADAARAVASEYATYTRAGKVVDERGYQDEVLGLFLPALEARWSEVQSDVRATHPHEADEIANAIPALRAKVEALAPTAEVDALAQTIQDEAREASVAPRASSGFEGDAAAFRDAYHAAVDLYEAGQKDAAIAALQDAYLDAYGPNVEPRILAASPALNAAIEDLLNVQMRDAMRRGATVAELKDLEAKLDAKLAEAQVAVQGDRSAGKLFFDSFLIMVREGFEAILVVGALATYVIRTGHAQKAKLLYWGAGLAALATLALWFAVNAVYQALPVNREILEGATALLAVVVLFYVSYWLISKIEVGKWNRFVQGKMKGALARGSAFSLAGVAFLAVFREGFETVLFYQGLYAGGSGSGAAVTLGVVVGLAVLAALFVGFYRFGVKIPMRPFFIVTSALLYYLAFAFLGKGVHELQEAGLVSTTLVPAFAQLMGVPVLGNVLAFVGFYPTLETALAQAVLILAIVGGLLWTLVWEPRRDAALAANA